MGSPSFVIGSSYSILSLSEDDRQRLDAEPWVFCCNSFLSHWELAGFRPTVWCWGDNHSPELVSQVDVELSAVSHDILLQRRLRHLFVGREEYARDVELAVRRWALPVEFYRRGEPWAPQQHVAQTLQETIFHYASTLTDLVNFAAILNPGEEIRIVGNELGPGFGHFYSGPREHPGDEAARFWRRVKVGMWVALGKLHQFGLPLVDCNFEHQWPMPLGVELPRQPLFA